MKTTLPSWLHGGILALLHLVRASLSHTGFSSNSDQNSSNLSQQELYYKTAVVLLPPCQGGTANLHLLSQQGLLYSKTVKLSMVLWSIP